LIVGIHVATNPSSDGKTTARDISDNGLPDEGSLFGQEPREISLSLHFNMHLTGENSRVELTVLVPQSIDRRQTVTDISYDPQPSEVFYEGDNYYARFIFINPTEDLDVIITGKAALFSYDLTDAMGMEKPSQEESLDRYLISELFIEKDSPLIIEAAENIEGQDDLELVEGLFDYVVKNTYYGEYSPRESGAEMTLKRRGGTCVDFSDLLVALCRTRGIPAKTIDGLIIDRPLRGEEFLEQLHSWVEVYLQEYGWVPFDPTMATGGTASFDQLYPIYLRVSDIRNDENLGYYWHLWSFYYLGDTVEFTIEGDFLPSGEY
jgi:transglutaminase-like putative cysteine protease